MTKTAWLLVLVSTASWSLAGPAKKQTVKQPSNEPFSSFEQIDRTLTSLTKQKEQLEFALAPADGSKATETKPGSGSRWARPAENVRRSARRIRLLAERQEQRYRTLRQPFGVRAFEALASRAAILERMAQKTKATRNETDAAKRRLELDGAALLLLRQFQSIAGGYGAARCLPRERPCCLPKESGADTVVACSWVCVRSAGACRKGLGGPAVRKK
jgi:hypothetical protein